jgi:TonB family protein
LLSPAEIVWPQALDGAEIGVATYKISVDEEGRVDDVELIATANERTNDSAQAQIRRWNFKPYPDSRSPVAFSVAVTLQLNTRKYGPKKPLSPAETLAMVSKRIEPHYGSQLKAGTTCHWRVAVDADGRLIEAIADRCGGTSMASYEALKNWSFRQLVIRGHAVPYRGEVIFTVPQAQSSS